MRFQRRLARDDVSLTHGIIQPTVDKARRARREQAAYEARRAQKRYKAVDPDNRVVARTPEREWESKLRELEEVERQYAEARRTGAWSCRRKIGRARASWRAISRRCGDRR